jgi:hypothetical protein
MKYYVGYKGHGRAWIFRSNIDPDTDKHPENVRFCFGGYRTRKQAEQVAMYQNYIIENQWNGPIPIWDNNHDILVSSNVHMIVDQAVKAGTYP